MVEPQELGNKAVAWENLGKCELCSGHGSEGQHKSAEDNECDVFVCEGKRLQTLNMSLAERNDDIMGRLVTRSDREARQVLERLNEDMKKQNSALTAYMTQLTNRYRGLQEILSKNKDGQAAMHVTDTAELLVKGLAIAEDEVRELRETLKSVEKQRDSYRDRLVQTDAELNSTTTEAYARMSVASTPPEEVASAQTPAEGVTADPMVSFNKPRHRGNQLYLSDGATSAPASSARGAQTRSLSSGYEAPAHCSSISMNSDRSSDAGAAEASRAAGKGSPRGCSRFVGVGDDRLQGTADFPGGDYHTTVNRGSGRTEGQVSGAATNTFEGIASATEMLSDKHRREKSEEGWYGEEKSAKDDGGTVKVERMSESESVYDPDDTLSAFF